MTSDWGWMIINQAKFTILRQYKLQLFDVSKNDKKKFEVHFIQFDFDQEVGGEGDRSACMW